MVRRFLPVFALALLAVVPSAEAKRRAVRSMGPVPPANTGGCHTFGFVRPGTKGTYVAENATGTATFTITHVSDSATLAVTTQKVQTPQGEADAETRIDMETVGSMRLVKHMKVLTSLNVPFLGMVTTETNVDWIPSLPWGPAAGWCTGAKWTIPAMTQTVTTSSPVGQIPPVVTTTMVGEGEVLAVNDVITVPAGTFNTVKYRNTILAGTSVQPAIVWMSMQHGILVRQDSLDAAGNVIQTTRLTAVQ
jgi:hypothetical protein